MIGHDRTVQFHQRVLQDALSEATALYWERRARQFEDAAPKPEDWPGEASQEQLQRARERCLSVASACRARASLEAAGAPLDAVVIDLWQVVA